MSPCGACVPSAAGLSPALSCPSRSQQLGCLVRGCVQWVLARVPGAVAGWQTDAGGGQSRLRVLVSTSQEGRGWICALGRARRRAAGA